MYKTRDRFDNSFIISSKVVQKLGKRTLKKHKPTYSGGFFVSMSLWQLIEISALKVLPLKENYRMQFYFNSFASSYE